MQEPIALVEGLSFTYAGASRPALEDLHLQVMPGEFVAITGPSGCGKSTLAFCLTGFIPHAFAGEMKGFVRVGGLDTRRVTPGKLAGISGLVQQDPEAQLCTLKVIDEVAFGPENLCLPSQEIKKRVEWALAAVDSLDLLFRDVYSLSGGEKQRVAIASVLAMTPGLLILDEPTANLDLRCTVEVLTAIEKLRRKKNTAIIVIEHRLSKVLPLADRLVVMEEGKITAAGEPRGIYAGYREKLSRSKKKPLPDLGCTLAASASPGAEAPEKFRGWDKPLLAVKNLTAGYTSTPVIAGIDFTLYPGDLLALMGDNGSGKTSLLHALLGILQPKEGHIIFQGREITGWSVARRARLMGLTFQNPNHQLFEKTVLREAQLPSLFLRQGEVGEHSVENLLEFFGLLPYKDRIPQALSMGEKKRLALVSVLAYQPPLLLLDEPLVGQDEEKKDSPAIKRI
jgi:energy-coupling factor transporter ATP-binding protein EcfA2